VPARERNSRVVAIEILRRIQKKSSDVVSVFRTEGKTTVFLDRVDRTDLGGYLRPRQRHEYAENRIEYWRWMRSEIRAINSDLVKLEILAMSQINRIEAEQAEASQEASS
jgi:hypothetical protein